MKKSKSKSTIKNVIELEFDIVEVHYNQFLKNKPYLIRVFNYNNKDPNEIRCEEIEVKNLYNTLKKNKLL